MPIDLRALHLRTCLGAIALLVSAPFLIAHHYNPIPSFFQEWTAAAISLFAVTALFHAWRDGSLEIPDIVALPIGLAILAILQWLFVPDVLPERLLLLCCYLAWAMALMVLGRYLVRIFGLQLLGDVVAGAILVGALLEAFSGFVQLAGMARLPWVFPPLSNGFRGNLAQPNSLSNYLWLGVASAVYLRCRGKLGPIPTALALLPLLPAGVLSGSRSIWLYSVGLALLSLAWTWRSKDNGARTLRHWSLGILAATLLCQFLLSSNLFSPQSSNGLTTAGGRVAARGFVDATRLVFWQLALEIFGDNPWLGAGFGQYTHQVYLRIPDLAPRSFPGLPEHAHNITLNLMAEMGLGAGLLLLIALFRWCSGLFHAPRSPEYWWVLALALILGIHSNLEYPLWYGFFLAIAALLAGAGSRSNWHLPWSTTIPYAVAGILAVGTFGLAVYYRDYSQLEDALNNRLPAESVADRREKVQAILQRLTRESPLSHYANFAIAHRMAESPDALEAKLHYCERALRFSASRDIAFKCSYIFALAGHDDQGRLALRRALASYPYMAGKVLDEWKQRSPSDPAIARLVAGLEP